VPAPRHGSILWRVERDRTGAAALVVLELVADALVLVQRREARALNGRNVHESVGAAIVRRDEAETLVDVEKLYGADL
jgi:hypothetical protein